MEPVAAWSSRRAVDREKDVVEIEVRDRPVVDGGDVARGAPQLLEEADELDRGFPGNALGARMFPGGLGRLPKIRCGRTARSGRAG